MLLSRATRDLALVAGLLAPLSVTAADHGLSLHGDLKYGPDFTHFDYVNPDAPKGGSVRLSALGTFDNLNPYILRGTSPSGMSDVFDTLTVQSADEPFSSYGLIAETIEVADDSSWVRFTLREEARFHDGEPITVEDVIWTFDTLQSDGHPQFRMYYSEVERAEKVGERAVKFHFTSTENAELPLIVGQMPVLPKHYWEDRDFTRTTTEPPLGSGPYRVSRVDTGRAIVYERVEDYWAADLPVNRGRFNFDRLRFDYYRDATVAVEAFKAGEYDLRQENIARNWATQYDIPAVRDGRIIMEEIDHEIPTGMQAFFFNTRKDKFADPRVRKALGYAFDFEWTNRTLFNDSYARTKSFFSNSELASEGLPEGRELEILENYREQLSEAVFDTVYEPPTTEGRGGMRANLRRALELLGEAGWEVGDDGLTHTETGEVMRLTVLLDNPSFERVTLPFTNNLERLGIDANVRTVDSSQYQNRMDEFDFDMTVQQIGQSMSPGNEQRSYWSCAAAETGGSRNYAGICDEAVDSLIDRVIYAADRDELVAATRALDRVLLHGHYVIPHWYLRSFRLVYWDKFERPEISPDFSLGFDTWWKKDTD
ncbi:extracellular solute-binding protein [Methylonatrum kenyense]|uniref:extracellular solute-binding protein n=1 Tax=Methylonatrum kenyense TaxID=455253 RepID=UPI0020BEBAA7|nr:extracellular solute-binding protein [Methylonatrum kenyense]MCK8515518.1 extracellular solute-binding protein [Methylonatrum kenyense]